MKYTLIFFITLLLFVFSSNAQYDEETLVVSTDSSVSDRGEFVHETIHSFDVFCSTKVFNNQFYNSFNQIDDIDFKMLLNEIGVWNDISKASWRPTLISKYSKCETYSISNFRQSGMRFSIGIGYFI